jgi:hypothetical protein
LPRRGAALTNRVQPEQGEEIGKVNETLCLHPFVIK